ncbi:MAG TPA: hypothetical protein PLK99_13015, partial [Burkholderiales bacterium]|nr:hypothetical protein [Burkholderiales bacterium]
NVDLSLGDKHLPAFEGEIDLGENGSFGHAEIRSAGMHAEITPQGAGYQIRLEAKKWKIPFGPDFPWDEIHAKAIADAKGAKITEFYAVGYGGEISGSGSMDWERGWHGSGKFSGKNLDIGRLMPYFSANGRISGTLAFNAVMASNAANFTALFDSPRFNSAFRITDGKVGIDIAQAIRAASPDGTRGGETKFDELTGTVSRFGRRYSFDKLRMTSGLMKTTGAFSLEDGKIGGRITVSLERMSSPFELGGSLSDPFIR